MLNLRAIALIGMLTTTVMTQAATPEDTYLAGYATGVLNHALKLNVSPLQVQEGVITLPIGGLQAADQTKAAQLLAEIPGVKGVKLAPSANSAADNETALAAPMSVDTAGFATQTVILPTGILPVGLLFKPFLADPRWAHFSAAYRNYQRSGVTGRDSVSVSFGETMPFYRANIGNSNVQWETGMQAGVFSDFNLDTPSNNLINSDFTVAAYGSLRSGQFSAFGRYYHQSSHVGDEYLIAQYQQTTNFQRVNLSYEALDLKLSYELPYGLRVYGGGGGFIDKDPATLKTWSTEYGVEFRSPWIIQLAAMRPIFAADIKNFQQNNWSSEISIKAGVEFDNTRVWGRKLQILAEYYDGNSPIGQFYQTKVQYAGIGAHFHF
jgi:hypothetical protein